ncbi:hypothetical protein H2201_002900 [Coniosporium apollinis]|uniref:Endo-1,3(4)-beta-glucanase 1 carbohydrate binding domain-containing protein n=1 Tax=Coniosporium apollinis TaxID=61459 RepID=A0ABQ9NXF1_9PEZI|nr:hypothetical protein H2201_002900 [Coniosporium apollinis]
MARFTLALVTALVAIFQVVAAEDTFTCGTAPYYPSQYTCFDGVFLCPKVNGLAYLRCGDACYNHNMYTCPNNKLVLIDWSVPERTQQCGTAPYYPSKYVCYNGNFLCPITGGTAYQRCGQACYSPSQYSCSNGQLKQVPAPECVREYSGCIRNDGLVLACCQGLSCVASKCRNLTNLLGRRDVEGLEDGKARFFDA